MEGDVKRFPVDFNPELGDVSLLDKLMISKSGSGDIRSVVIEKVLESTVSSSKSQQISGKKQFTESPIVPQPNSDMAAAPKKYVDDKMAENYADLIPFILDGSVVAQYNADVTYRVDVVSSNGVIFKNDDIRTTLAAVVYRGITDVTSQIDANCFRWSRKSADATADALWNQAHFGHTKTIEVYNIDVFLRATFNCEVILQ